MSLSPTFVAGVAGHVDVPGSVGRKRVAAVGHGRDAELAQPGETPARVELGDEDVVGGVAGVGTVEVAVRVAGDDDIAGRVDRDPVRPLEP